MDKIRRKDPRPIELAVKEYIKEMKLAAGLNNQRIFKAWDEVSGAAKWTSARFFRDGVLYITLTSSVARNQLTYRLDAIVKAINDALMKDELFVKDDPRSRLVTRIVLK